MERFIFHVDLDAFFASVVLLDHPEYQGVPLIVGADPKNGKGRGVVSTCSYEAREYGIHSGMPISQAWERCSFGIYTRPKFGRIQEISGKVMTLLRDYNSIEQVSIDEAYFDLSNHISSIQEASKIALEIKDRVQKEIGVTCSIGISFSKTLAKIGSDVKKPNGITILTPENYQVILSNLPITRIPGIGKKSKPYYEQKGFFTLGDVFKTPLHRMIAIFGERSGSWVWNSAHGIDGRMVHDESESHTRKSISKERTFLKDVSDPQVYLQEVAKLNDRLHLLLEEKKLAYRTITIKIRFQGFETYTRSRSFSTPLCNQMRSSQVINEILEEFITSDKKVRLIGLKFSNFNVKTPAQQKSLMHYFPSLDKKK